MIDKDKVYVENLRNSLRANPHAVAFYFPRNKAKRRKMNLRFGREIGYGLESGDIQGLYSTLIVAFSLDTTGVCIDAKEFFAAIREGQRKAREA